MACSPAAPKQRSGRCRCSGRGPLAAGARGVAHDDRGVYSVASAGGGGGWFWAGPAGLGWVLALAWGFGLAAQGACLLRPLPTGNNGSAGGGWAGSFWAGPAELELGWAGWPGSTEAGMRVVSRSSVGFRPR